jgi:hypothetical protein
LELIDDGVRPVYLLLCTFYDCPFFYTHLHPFPSSLRLENFAFFAFVHYPMDARVTHCLFGRCSERGRERKVYKNLREVEELKWVGSMNVFFSFVVCVVGL